MLPTIEIDPIRHGPPGLRTFLNIAELWNLTVEQQITILGIRDLATFDSWKVRVQTHEAVSIPMEVIERIGCVLSIYGSLVTLFPDGRTSHWLRSRNANSSLGGMSALEKMITGELQDLKAVVGYLLAEIHGR